MKNVLVDAVIILIEKGKLIRESKVRFLNMTGGAYAFWIVCG